MTCQPRCGTGVLPSGRMPCVGWPGECFGGDGKCFCSQECRDAGRPLDPRSAAPEGQQGLSGEAALRSIKQRPRTTVKRFAEELKARISRVETAFSRPGQEQWVSGARYIQGVVDALLSDYDVRDPGDLGRTAPRVPDGQQGEAKASGAKS